MAQFTWPPVNVSVPAIVIDASGQTGDAIPADALLVGFEDPSGNLAPAKVSAGGELLISSSTLALESTLQDVLADTTVIAAKDFATETTLAALNAKVTAVNTGAVVVSSSALPTGAATQATLASVLTDTSALVAKDFATETSLAAASAKLPATLGQKAAAASLAVVLASDQAAIPAQVNTAGSIVNTALVATTASSASPPANAVGFILEAPSDNTHNIRWCVGGTASTTTGMLAEPGRDSGFVPISAAVSVCAVTSGTNAFSIQWVQSS